MKRKHRLPFFRTQIPNNKSVCNLVIVDDSQLRHGLLGHLNFTDFRNAIPKTSHYAKKTLVCELCAPCKIMKVTVPPEVEVKSTKILEKVFIDILGHLNFLSVLGFRYARIIVDEYYKLKIVKFFCSKGEALKKFQEILAEHRIPKILRYVFNEEFTSKHFKR